MSTFALILYIVLWIIAFYVHQKRTKYFGAGSAIILMFLIYSLISLFVYYTADSLIFNQKPLRIIPFIYLFVCIVIVSYPVLKYNEATIEKLAPPHTSLIHVFTYVYLFCAVIRIPEVLSNLSTGITMILLNVDAGQDLYNDAHDISNSSGGISNLFAIIYNVFSDASILFFFYYLIFYPKRKITIAVFAISILIQILTQISMGLRTDTVMKAMSVVIAFITMRRFIHLKLRRTIYLIGGAFIGLLFVLIISVSLSRFQYREGGLQSGTLEYVGMGNLVFNETVWDVHGTRNGDRTANLFKSMLGFSNVPNSISAVRNKYSSLGVDDSVFYTFVGDFVLDYGKVLTLVIFVFFSFLFCRITKTRRGIIKMNQMMVLYFVMCVVVQGGFYLFSYSFSRNLAILGFLVVYIILTIDSNSKKKKNDIGKEKLCI